MTQPQETATTGKPEEPTQGSAPVAGDTVAGAKAEDTQAGGQPKVEAASPVQSDDDGVDSETKKALADLPPPVKKHLDKYFTQRTQKLSAREKELEQTIAALNQVAESVRQNQPAAPPPAPPEDALALQQIEQLFGSEAAQAFDKLSQARAGAARAEVDKIRGEAHARELKETYHTFLRENPDAKTLEPVMTQIATQFQPNGMEMGQYFKTLRLLALEKTGQLEAEYTKKAIERMQASAKVAEPASSGVSSSKVTPTPPDLTKMSLNEAVKAAAEAAKRGERWNQ